jgi:hypothetical protein
VRVSNDPLSAATGGAAQDVAAEVTYYDEGSVEPMTVTGRWGDTDQPATRSALASMADLTSVDFPPNGVPHELDLVIKMDADEECYAYTTESQLYGTHDDSRRLKGRVINIRVRLRGADMEDVETWYRLTNDGPDQDLTITQTN